MITAAPHILARATGAAKARLQREKEQREMRFKRVFKLSCDVTGKHIAETISGKLDTNSDMAAVEEAVSYHLRYGIKRR